MDDMTQSGRDYAETGWLEASGLVLLRYIRKSLVALLIPGAILGLAFATGEAYTIGTAANVVMRVTVATTMLVGLFTLLAFPASVWQEYVESKRARGGVVPPSGRRRSGSCGSCRVFVVGPYVSTSCTSSRGFVVERGREGGVVEGFWGCVVQASRRRGAAYQPTLAWTAAWRLQRRL